MKRMSAISILFVLSAGCAPSRTLPSFDTVVRGTSGVHTTSAEATTRLSQLKLRRLVGGVEDPTHFESKVVVVDVWASWCDPCKESLPEAQSFAAELQDKPFELVTINVDEQDAPVQKFLAMNGLDTLASRVLRDPGGDFVRRTMRVADTPTTLIFDAAGRLRFTHRGASAEITKRVRSEVLSLLRD